MINPVLLAPFVAVMMWLGQVGEVMFPHSVPVAAAPSGPAYVNSAGDWSGDGTVDIATTTGNRLVVWTIANDGTTTHTCTDNAAGGTNTYVPDGAVASGTSVVGRMFHVASLKSTATITITCNGTTPAVGAVQYSGGTGALDTASAGGTGGNAIIGVALNDAAATCSPGSFTPTTAATIMVDAFGSATGANVTAFVQTDSSYTTRSSCTNGGSCFVGEIGSRVVTSSASYADGLSWTGSVGDRVCMHAAYK